MTTDISDRAWQALYRRWYGPEPEPLPFALPVALAAVVALAFLAVGLVLTWLR